MERTTNLPEKWEEMLRRHISIAATNINFISYDGGMQLNKEITGNFGAKEIFGEKLRKAQIFKYYSIK